jgi:proliferating cell nuclear antigen
MVLIKKYKGLEIHYDDKKFKATDPNNELGTNNPLITEKPTEDEVIKHIDVVIFDREQILLKELKKIPKDFKITVAFPELLKTNFSMITNLVNEVSLVFDKNKLSVIAMDNANIAMVIFELLKTSALEWDINKKFKIGINTSTLHTILTDANSQDMITISFCDEKNVSIKIKGQLTRSFKIPIIELEDFDVKIPKLEFNVKALTSPKLLRLMVKGADKTSESITFQGEKEKIYFTAKGDLSEFNAKIGVDEASINHEEDSKSKYSIEYLKKIFAKNKLYKETEICFSKDYPLRVNYHLKDKCNLIFILAPRVEND